MLNHLENMDNELLGYEFKLTPEIKMLKLDILMIKLLLKEETDEEGKALLKKDMLELKQKFIKEFRKNNKKEIDDFLKLLRGNE